MAKNYKWTKEGTGKVLYFIKQWKDTPENYYKPVVSLDITPYLYPVGLLWNVRVKQNLEVIEDESFKTKTKALKFAKEYMRKH